MGKLSFIIFFFISITGFSQRSYWLTGGYYSNTLKTKDIDLLSRIGRQSWDIISPSFGIGISLDSTRLHRISVKQTFFMGVEFYDGHFETVYHNSWYTATSIYLRYTPRILFWKHFYIGPLINFSCRVQYTGDDGLENFGVIDRLTQKNMIRVASLRAGGETGLYLLKNRMVVGIQMSYGVFPSLQVYYTKPIKFYNNSAGAFLSYRVYKEHKKK